MTVIPFHRVEWMGRESTYVTEAMANGYIGGDGPYTRKVETNIRDLIEVPWVRLTNSCTAALEIAALLGRFEAGDEVIMPSFTFVSTANAVCLRSARPVFVDIRPDTLNLDESRIEAAITPRTRAIIPVHYAGVVCEMDAITELARRHGLLVIEDAAQAFLCRYHGRSAGTLGDIGCFSFHESKTFHAGEGGALVLREPSFIERAEILREKGTNRTQFMVGRTDKYTWHDVGSSFAPSDLMAAILLGQIECADAIVAVRRRLFEAYMEALEPLSERELVRLPTIPPHCATNFHFFYLLTRTPEERVKLLNYLRCREIYATFHYVPLHSSPFGRAHGLDADLPVTDLAAATLIRLPLYNTMTDAEFGMVVDALFSYFGITRSSCVVSLNARNPDAPRITAAPIA